MSRQKQSSFEEIPIRQGKDDPLDSAHAPVLLTRVSAKHGVFVSNAELFQVSDPGPGILPLFPDKTPQTADDPAFQGFEQVPDFRQAVIAPPPYQVLIQLFDDLA